MRIARLKLLDFDDPQQNEFAQTLNLLAAQGHIDQPENSSWLIARDTVTAAVNLIGEHREKQMRDEFEAQFQRGEITEGE